MLLPPEGRILPMLTCFDIANYFIAMVADAAGDSISNLKVHCGHTDRNSYLAKQRKKLPPSDIRP